MSGRARRLALVIAAALLGAGSARAAVVPSTANVYFQTGGRERPPTIGDWYTTSASSSTDRIHRFLIEITAEQLTACGGICDIVVQDAESAAGAGPNDEVTGTGDPTQFSLRDRTGTIVLQGPVTVASGSANGTNVTFTVSAVGVYQLTSVDGAFPISGNATVDLNDDDNSFQINVEQALGGTGGWVGVPQSTYQHSAGGDVDFTLYFPLGPTGTDQTLAFRNFDLDGGADNVSYDDPPGGGAVGGTISNNGIWNGAGGTLNTGQDNVAADSAFPGGTDIGAWSYAVDNWTTDNQSSFEVVGGGVDLPLMDSAPVRAGNFEIGPPTASCGSNTVSVFQTFAITNHFMTNDVINLTVSAAPAGWTTGQFQTNAGVALTDTDGNGQLDTGIMTPGQTLTFRLQTTGSGNGRAKYNATISAVSLMDARVGATNTTRTVVKEFYLCPEVAKSFVAATVSVGVNSTLTLTITNRNTSALSSLSFTDSYPTNLVNATPLTVGGTCTSVTHGAAAGGNTFNVTAGNVPAASSGGPNGTCTITIAVRSSVAGPYNNQTGGASAVATGDAIGPGASSNTATLTVTGPSLTLVKASVAQSDPFNGTVNPKRIPGGFVTYNIVMTNSGSGTVDNNTTFIVDPIPPNTDLFVANIGGAGSGPVSFANGTPTSGLTYTFTSLGSTTDDVAFSNDGGATYTYTPVPNANNVDPNVTHIRINPKGVFAGDSVAGAPSPNFTVGFRVRVE